MTCSPERVALYVGGDLAPADESSLGEHLVTCTSCHRLLVSLQGDVAKLQRLEPALETILPRVARRRAPLRWVPAAAVALLTLGLVVPAVQAMGRVFELFPFLTVRELSAEELAELGRQNPRPDPVKEAHRYPRQVPTVEDAEAYAGFRVPRLDPPPTGFIPRTVLVTDLEGGKSVQQTFHNPENDGFINLALNSREQNNFPRFVGTMREVTVNGENAVLVTWPPDFVPGRSMRDLHFQWQGHAASLTLTVLPENLERYPDEDLIQIAESLR